MRLTDPWWGTRILFIECIVMFSVDCDLWCFHFIWTLKMFCVQFYFIYFCIITEYPSIFLQYSLSSSMAISRALFYHSYLISWNCLFLTILVLSFCLFPVTPIISSLSESLFDVTFPFLKVIGVGDIFLFRKTKPWCIFFLVLRGWP